VARTTALERGEHGTVAAWSAGCRCRSCRKARYRYARAWWSAKNILRGAEARWKVDARPVAAHLEALRAAGWRLRDVAAVSGVPYATLLSIRKADRRGAGPRCMSTTAERVLALDPRARR
jgi:hypothetical protein